MTNLRKLSTATAALALSTVMSTAAFAADNDMNCGDFNAMTPDDQLSALSEMGREGARDSATGEDATEAGVATEQANDDGTMNDDAGKEGRDDMARGDDEMMEAVVEHCKGGDDLMIKDVAHPTAG
jgi:hypothetical protein